VSVWASGACGGSPPADSRTLEGADLIAGTSIPRHGLLVIPRSGGSAELRAVDDPSRIRWSGTEILPATQAAYSLGRSAVLRGEDGVVTVFQPSGEVVWEAGTVPPEARWVAADEGGAFVWTAGALVFRPEATRESTRTIASGHRILWAAPASGDRVVALTQSADSARLEVWEPGDTEPSSVHSVDAAGPALLTARGREVILTGGKNGRTLIGRMLPELEPIRHTVLGAAPIILASSPSEHRVFAASDDDPGLVVIDRYGWRTLRPTSLDMPVREVRPAVTGDLVLAFDGTQIWDLRAGEKTARKIVGEWRIDLPMGLPGGRILTVVGGVIRWLEADGEESTVVDGPEDAWWLPVRWTPRRVEPFVSPPSVKATDGGVGAAPDEVEQVQVVGLTTMGRVAGRAVPETELARDPLAAGSALGAGPETGPPSTVPGGFYAVASSSRKMEGLKALRRSLEASGYSTQVLTRRDEANDLWYRLLVGPYASRGEAEAAVSSLQRERGISAWIHEAIGPTAGGVR